MAGKIPCHIFLCAGFTLFLSVCLSIQSHWEFLYLPVFVSIILLEHRASFSNIKHFEENEKRHLECAFCWSCLNFLSTTLEKKQTNERAVYKSGTGTRGRGHQDACVGTWDLGTRDEGLEDIKYGTQRRVGWGRGDVIYRDAGDAGCEWLLQWVGGKCDISFFVKMRYWYYGEH